MRVPKPAIVCFALVFATGSALGVVRMLWLVPREGPRAAELLEVPVMLAVTVLAARWTVRQFAPTHGPAARLGIGLIALGFVLAADLGVAVFLRGMSPAEAFTARDPVSGAAYYGSLLLFAAMPWLVGRH